MPIKRWGYEAAFDFIMSREHFGIKLGLENITGFLNRIDNPQNKYPSIHIAGTNGKGSTAAYIESIMRQAGYRTGIFTSPHLVDFRERIRINGEQISKAYITSFIRKYNRLISLNKITFFEVCTALAFSYFEHKKVNIAIVETGLGGRLDATNTLTPLLSIITDISFDHTNILGNTLRKIAFEKAGIIKSHVPVLVGIMKPEPRSEIVRVGSRRKAPLLYFRRTGFSQNGFPYRFDYHHNQLKISNLRSPLPGRHQIINAALSIRAVEFLSATGFSIGSGDIRKGLKNVSWPGRFQVIRRPGRPTLILDVCHNPAGVKSMVDCFRELYPGRKADMVIGFVRNKNLQKSIGFIRPLVKRVEVVRLGTHRTAEPEEVASYFGRRMPVRISNSVVDSCRGLIGSAKDDDIIIICGSHFVVGDFLASRNKIL
jgi:dihydrofolate synthase/folylpolyglutamate synthase